MTSPLVLLESHASGEFPRSFRFDGFRNEIVAVAPDEVIPALEAVTAQVAAGFHAAGYVSYEAAAGCAPHLRTHPQGALPLLWFGIFTRREEVQPETEVETPTVTATDWHSSLDAGSYRRKVEHIRDRIAAGETYQVNFTFRRQFRLSGDPFDFYRQLCRSQRAPFCAYIATGRWRIASASPELFFRLDGRKITVEPMKGTALRGRWPEEDAARSRGLQESRKEQAENLMIVDLLRNDLGAIATPGSVQVKTLFDVRTLETVHQMTSTVTAALREEVTFPQLFVALFPCGSVTGAPKRRTMDIIAAEEDSPRGVYTGCIGYISPGGDATFSVAIRTAVIDAESGKGVLGIGSGITWDSSPSAEYHECLAKSLFATHTHPDFELVETLRLDEGGHYRLLRRHLRRLEESARYFGFPFRNETALHMLEGEAAGTAGPAKIRLLLGRNGSMRIETSPLVDDPAGAVYDAALAGTAVNSRDPFLYHKTTHRPVYAEELARNPGVVDVIFVNERGELTEGANHNLVLHLDGCLATPPREAGLLGGTFRAMLLAEGVLREKVLTPDDLRRAEAVYLINSVRGWRRTRVIE